MSLLAGRDREDPWHCILTQCTMVMKWAVDEAEGIHLPAVGVRWSWCCVGEPRYAGMRAGSGRARGEKAELREGILLDVASTFCCATYLYDVKQ